MSEAPRPFRYETIAISEESTVVAEFVPDVASVQDAAYQSEDALERAFIRQLQAQAYDYLPLTSEAELIANLRFQLEKLNKVSLSDAEWERFFATAIAGANDGIIEKTTRIQQDHVQVLKRDDGTTKNIYLIDKTNIHNNTLQVLNQYEANGARANRYDVTVLVNGLPMVHIELKRRGVDIREAFNQINRYARDSFWAGSGLFDYVQLFVISNGTLTKYYSNTVRDGHLAEQRGKRSRQKSSNSFAFTSWWADAANRPITELAGFTKTFFAKHTLLNILTRYCVFDVDRKLLVMRPYQIVAAEKILQRIAGSTNLRQLGTPAAGGYIWHTTGSGKTLTSFKAAQLARSLPGIDKVLFVVDRKDLDYQTIREYERFEKGAANSNTSTAVLQRQLEDPNARIIITTIQKLSRFVAANRKHHVYNDHIVVIFDECHRSQFGDMHAEIARVFKRYHLFGFTGTPIFAENSGTGGDPRRRTTQQAFGDKLHTYTIVDAINDKNVLPFRIDYINTIKAGTWIKDKQVSAIDTERALLAPERIAQIVGYIREHFDQKTKRSSSYRHDGKRLTGFNSLLATASIDAAKRYYAEFSKQQQSLPEAQRLKIGLIYSFAANEDEEGGLLGEEEFETDQLDQGSRDFLEGAIRDYNTLFNTNFDTSADKFQNYYKDLSQRLKKRELDMVIVVNMFLTGFDATTLNTLWADIRVDWETGFEQREWYHYTYQPTIWEVYPRKEMARRLIAFAFEGADQDYDWFLANLSNWKDMAEAPVPEVDDAPDPRKRNPINLILYGPPGTGKTYRTMAEAVRLALGLDEADPILTDAGRRIDLRTEYDRLIALGRHPWLDAAVETATHLIGVESKRFEPFRDSKLAKLSPKYSSHQWDEGMEPWCAMRDHLLAEPAAFRHLDAAQLVKHGFGLVTEAKRRGKSPVLLYLFAEPTEGRAIKAQAIADHRSEIARFAGGVADSMVRFVACSWCEWLTSFPTSLSDHADRVIARFHP